MALCNSDYMVKLTEFSNCILVPPVQFLVFVSAARKCPEYQPEFFFWLRPCLAAISAHCYCFFCSPNPLPSNTTFSQVLALKDLYHLLEYKFQKSRFSTPSDIFLRLCGDVWALVNIWQRVGEVWAVVMDRLHRVCTVRARLKFSHSDGF